MSILNKETEEIHRNTLKSSEIKIGASFCLGEQKAPEKIDLNNEGFLDKLTPELSQKIKETISQAQNKAQIILQEANQEAENIKKQAFQQGLQEGHQAGQKQGFEEGIQQGIEEFRQRLIRADRLVGAIVNLKSQIYHSSEEELLEFVMLLANKLATVELQLNSEALKNLIRLASSELKEKEDVKILVHPEFAQKVFAISDEIKNAIYGMKNLKIIEDKSLGSDDILLESQSSRVNAGLSSRIDELLSNLKDELKSTPLLDETLLLQTLDSQDA